MGRANSHTTSRIRATMCAGAAAAAMTLGAAACGGSDSPTESATESADESAAAPADTGAPYPEVLDAVARRDGDTWTFEVTMSSPYDTPERYADGWRVIAPDGTELGFRLLTHDHASEQPFTRSLAGVEIPDDVDTVIIEGRDLANGFGGATFEVALRR